jgi:hypothetical protein
LSSSFCVALSCVGRGLASGCDPLSKESYHVSNCTIISEVILNWNRSQSLIHKADDDDFLQLNELVVKRLALLLREASFTTRRNFSCYDSRASLQVFTARCVLVLDLTFFNKPNSWSQRWLLPDTVDISKTFLVISGNSVQHTVHRSRVDPCGV